MEEDLDPHSVYEDRRDRFMAAIKKYQTTNVAQINQRADKEEKQELGKIRNDAEKKNQEDFKKMEDTIKVAEKIFKSRKINECRMSEMKVRFDMVERIQEEAKRNLRKQVENVQTYKALLKNLIVQGMIKLMQQKIQVRCLKAEQRLVGQVLEESESEFNSMCEITTKLVINKNNYLTETDLGGVILTSFTGRIVCDNTLKARLNYCVQLLLPDIRKILFQVSDNELGKARKQKKDRELQLRKLAREREKQSARVKQLQNERAKEKELVKEKRKA